MCFLCPPVAAGWGAFVSSGSFWPSTERDTVPLWALNEERCLLSGLTRLLGPITHRQHASTIQMLISSSARPVLGLLPKRFDWTLPQSATWTHQIDPHGLSVGAVPMDSAGNGNQSGLFRGVFWTSAVSFWGHLDQFPLHFTDWLHLVCS